MCLHATVRGDGANADHLRYELPQFAEVLRLYIPVDQGRVAGYPGKMLPVDIDQPGDGLFVEHLADQVEESPQRHAEQLSLVAGKGKTAHVLVAQQHEVRQHGHGHAGVVPLYDLVGIELPPPPGGGEGELPAVAQDDTLPLVPADAAHDGLRFRQLRLAFIAPDVHTVRGDQNRQAGEVALDADALDLLYPALEIPVPVAVAQDAPSLRVAFPAPGFEVQGLFQRDEYLVVQGRGALHQPGQVVALIVLPFPERVLGADRQLAPAYEAIVVLAAGLRVPGVPHAPLVDDFVVAPAVGEERQHLGNKLAPGFLHIVHARAHELRRVQVPLRGTSLLDAPVALTHQHFGGEQDGTDNIVVFGHLLVDFHAPASLQFPQEFLIYPACVETVQAGLAILSELVHALRRLLSALSMPVAFFAQVIPTNAGGGLAHQIQNSLDGRVHGVLVGRSGEPQEIVYQVCFPWGELRE